MFKLVRIKLVWIEFELALVAQNDTGGAAGHFFCSESICCRRSKGHSIDKSSHAGQSTHQFPRSQFCHYIVRISSPGLTCPIANCCGRLTACLGIPNAKRHFSDDDQILARHHLLLLVSGRPIQWLDSCLRRIFDGGSGRSQGQQIW